MFSCDVKNTENGIFWNLVVNKRCEFSKTSSVSSVLALFKTRANDEK